MFTESASLDKERMLKYKAFAVAFSYPEDGFFTVFPELEPEKRNLMLDYDELFRAQEVWLYGTEHLAKNEFQRSTMLSDIMGFYRAFGLEPDRERPDSLDIELEFMHYLIFKKLRALEDKGAKDAEDKAAICVDAQKKFFDEHLYPAATKIAESILAKSKGNFYSVKAKEILEFMESEKRFLKEHAR